MDRRQDRRADDGPGGHAEEREGTDDAERARPRRAAEQVRRCRGPDRDEDAAADRLDEPCRDQLVHRLGRPRERRAER